ncbi:MAG: hypothetical protein JNN30_21700 [Rhodanobacteraceae bacterium]|nr:hypothetical protein [Rhodanobacteraceae bacterium]
MNLELHRSRSTTQQHRSNKSGVWPLLLSALTLALSINNKAMAEDGGPDMCLEDAVATISPASVVVQPGQAAVFNWTLSTYSCTVTLDLGSVRVATGTAGGSGQVSIVPNAGTTTYDLIGRRNGQWRQFATVQVVVQDPAAYTSANTPVCTSAQTARHNEIVAAQQSIDVSDPFHAYIGPYEGDGFLWRNWKPIDRFKRASCGYLGNYGFYTGTPLIQHDREADLNLYITPSAYFQRRITLPVDLGLTLPHAVLNGAGTCGTNGSCMEAEVTHHPSLNSPWFPPVDNAPSPVEGSDICAYGPYVADGGHAGRPEIHPSEALWWKSVPTPSGVIQESRVMLVQDDSNRFDDRVADFVPDMPLNMKAWSGGTMTSFIRYAFRVPLAGGPAQYLHVWNEPRSRIVNTYTEYPDDVTTGTHHTLSFDGVPRFTIVEQGPRESELSVVYDHDLTNRNDLFDVCKRADGTLQGYALMRARYGIGSPDSSVGEGYAEVLLRHSYAATDAGGAQAMADAAKRVKPPAQSSVLDTTVDFDSLQLVTDDAGASLRGDLLIGFKSGVTLARASEKQGRELPSALETQSKDGGKDWVRVRGVDLAGGQVLNLELSNGENVSGSLPGLGIAFELMAQPTAKASTPQQRATAWRRFVRNLHVSDASMPKNFALIDRWLVSSAPAFSAKRNGRVSREDQHGVAEYLNRGLGDEKAVTTLAKAIKTVQWREAGRIVAGGDSEFSHQVVLGTGADSASIEVTLQVDDIFSGSHTRSIGVVNQGILENEPSAWIETLATLAGVDQQELAREPRLGSDGEVTELEANRGLLLQAASNSLRDGVVTQRELKAQIELARSIARQITTDKQATETTARSASNGAGY